MSNFRSEYRVRKNTARFLLMFYLLNANLISGTNAHLMILSAWWHLLFKRLLRPFCFIVATFKLLKLHTSKTFRIQNPKSKIQNGISHFGKKQLCVAIEVKPTRLTATARSDGRIGTVRCNSRCICCEKNLTVFSQHPTLSFDNLSGRRVS